MEQIIKEQIWIKLDGNIPIAAMDFFCMNYSLDSYYNQEDNSWRVLMAEVGI